MVSSGYYSSLKLITEKSHAARDTNTSRCPSNKVDLLFLLARSQSLKRISISGIFLVTAEYYPRKEHWGKPFYQDRMSRTSDENNWPENEYLLNQMLVWVHCAQRPLTVQELKHAVTIRPHSTKFNRLELPDFWIMRTVSTGLLEIGGPSDKVRFRSSRAEVYVQRSLGRWLNNANTEIARACLTYLRYHVFLEGASSSDEEFESRLNEYALYEYAAANWGHHAREAARKAKEATETPSYYNCSLGLTRAQCAEKTSNFNFEEYDTLKEEAISFLQGGPCFDAALQAVKAGGIYHSKLMAKRRAKSQNIPKFHNYSQKIPRGMIGIHIAAWYGLTDVIPALVKHGQDPNTQTAIGRTPLSWAASDGHNDMISLLIDKYGADPLIKAGGGIAPLNFAASRGHESVVTDLIDAYGVGLESPSNAGRTALADAAISGHEGVVRALIQRGANFNAIEEIGLKTPLMFAVLASSESTVETLIKAGATISSIDKHGRTALALAAELNFPEIALKIYLSSPKSTPHGLCGPRRLSPAARVRMMKMIRNLKTLK